MVNAVESRFPGFKPVITGDVVVGEATPAPERVIGGGGVREALFPGTTPQIVGDVEIVETPKPVVEAPKRVDVLTRDEEKERETSRRLQEFANVIASREAERIRREVEEDVRRRELAGEFRGLSGVELLAERQRLEREAESEFERVRKEIPVSAEFLRGSKGIIRSVEESFVPSGVLGLEMGEGVLLPKKVPVTVDQPVFSGAAPKPEPLLKPLKIDIVPTKFPVVSPLFKGDKPLLEQVSIEDAGGVVRALERGELSITNDNVDEIQKILEDSGFPVWKSLIKDTTTEAFINIPSADPKAFTDFKVLQNLETRLSEFGTKEALKTAGITIGAALLTAGLGEALPAVARSGIPILSSVGKGLNTKLASRVLTGIYGASVAGRAKGALDDIIAGKVDSGVNKLARIGGENFGVGVGAKWLRGSEGRPFGKLIDKFKGKLSDLKFARIDKRLVEKGKDFVPVAYESTPKGVIQRTLLDGTPISDSAVRAARSRLDSLTVIPSRPITRDGVIVGWSESVSVNTLKPVKSSFSGLRTGQTKLLGDEKVVVVNKLTGQQSSLSPKDIRVSGDQVFLRVGGQFRESDGFSVVGRLVPSQKVDSALISKRLNEPVIVKRSKEFQTTLSELGVKPSRVKRASKKPIFVKPKKPKPVKGGGELKVFQVVEPSKSVTKPTTRKDVLSVSRDAKGALFVPEARLVFTPATFKPLKVSKGSVLSFPIPLSSVKPSGDVDVGVVSRGIVNSLVAESVKTSGKLRVGSGSRLSLKPVVLQNPRGEVLSVPKETFKVLVGAVQRSLTSSDVRSKPVQLSIQKQVNRLDLPASVRESLVSVRSVPGKVSVRVPKSFTIPIPKIKGQIGAKRVRLSGDGVGGGFAGFVKRRGVNLRVTKSLPKNVARDLGSLVADETLAASFKVLPVNEPALKRKPTGDFSRRRSSFRDFRRVKGKKVKLPVDSFIELRGKRLNTKNEVRSLLLAKKKKGVRKRRKR